MTRPTFRRSSLACGLALLMAAAGPLVAASRLGRGELGTSWMFARAVSASTSPHGHLVVFAAFGVDEDYELSAVRLDRDGRPLDAQPIRIGTMHWTHYDDASEYAVANDGTDWFIAFSESVTRRMRVARVTAEGAVSLLPGSGGRGQPRALAWTPAGLVLVHRGIAPWETETDVVLLDAGTGEAISGTARYRRVDSGDISVAPSLLDLGQILIASFGNVIRLDPSALPARGTRVDRAPEVALDTGGARSAIAATEDGFVLAWNGVVERFTITGMSRGRLVQHEPVGAVREVLLHRDGTVTVAFGVEGLLTRGEVAVFSPGGGVARADLRQWQPQDAALAPIPGGVLAIWSTVFPVSGQVLGAPLRAGLRGEAMLLSKRTPRELSPRIAAGSASKLAVWLENDGTYSAWFRLLDAGGNPLAPPTRLGPSSSIAPDVGSDDEGYLIVWFDETGGAYRATRVTEAGVAAHGSIYPPAATQQPSATTVGVRWAEDRYLVTLSGGLIETDRAGNPLRVRNYGRMFVGATAAGDARRGWVVAHGFCCCGLCSPSFTIHLRSLQDLPSRTWQIVGGSSLVRHATIASGGNAIVAVVPDDPHWRVFSADTRHDIARYPAAILAHPHLAWNGSVFLLGSAQRLSWFDANRALGFTTIDSAPDGEIAVAPHGSDRAVVVYQQRPRPDDATTHLVVESVALDPWMRRRAARP